MTEKRAGLIPYYVEGEQIHMLFMKPSDSDHGGTSFQIAKGIIEQGEDEELAAKREAKEELGLFLGNIDKFYRLGTFGRVENITVFLAQIKDPDMFGDPHFETKEVKWMAPSEFDSIGISWQRPIVRAAVRQILIKESLLLKESSLSRVWQHTQDHAIGLITAFRGSIEEDGQKRIITRRENLARNFILRAKILPKKYWITTIKGVYIEDYGTSKAKKVAESSFFVVNPMPGDDNGALERDLIQWGEEFNQESIISKRYGEATELIGTSKSDSHPGYGVRVQIPNMKFGKEGEFFSRVKGRPFKFESYNADSPPATINGWWGQSILAKKDWRELAKEDHPYLTD